MEWILTSGCRSRSPRSIAASAIEIFRVLATPAIHPALDGSGMLRAVWDQPVLGRVGDTFKMPMYLPEIGDYLMLKASQGIRDDVADGQSWIPAMEQTLERLAARVEPT
jgi:hypothetical protein